MNIQDQEQTSKQQSAEQQINTFLPPRITHQTPVLCTKYRAL